MKKIICFIISVVVLVSIISVFAIDNMYIITEYSDTSISIRDGNGVILFNEYEFALQNKSDVVMWGVYYDANHSPRLTIISFVPGVTVWYATTPSYSGTAGIGNSFHGDNGTCYYGPQWSVNTTNDNNVTIYANLDELLNAYIDFYNNGMTDTTGNNFEYSLPPGNLAIIETDSNYSHLNLSTVMPLQSTSFSNNPWPNSTQRIGMYNSLPANLNPSTMGNVIEWQKSGNASLFGITTSAAYYENVISTFKYIVISNPFYYPANDMEDRQYTNGNINISMDGVVNITVKNLTATVNKNTGEVENNENGSEWTGSIDPETGGITWTDQDGEPSTPTSGGNLSDPSINGFQSWLKGILQSIISIFEPAHDAIQTLSGTVSNFANWLYALYIWLPASILSVLKAAITLSIVIGVIKVFI